MRNNGGIEMIKIFNEDCFGNMARLEKEGFKADIILTSPPYNTGRNDERYDLYSDDMSTKKYANWSVRLFESYDKILNDNGVIIYNISYGSECPNDMYIAISNIIERTSFMISDCVVWKKSNAMPNSVSSNKLTRICEFVFIFCRKSEYKTYRANKPITSRRPNGQLMYGSIPNFIEAVNNDGATDLNKATFSTEFVEKMLDMYAIGEDVMVYDSFMGTGTTAVCCKQMGYSCYGSEISKAQCKYADERLNGVFGEEHEIIY